MPMSRAISRIRRGLARILSTNLITGSVVAGLMVAAGAVPDARAQNERAQQQQQLVDRSTLAVQDVLAWKQNGGTAQNLLRKAKGVIICPSIFRMSFLFGGSGGGCVLLSRDAAGSWSAPAFYSMGSGSFGLQAGIQDAELVMFVMTHRGLTAIMDSQFKFGADASVAFATLGAGMEGSTTAALRADIVAVEKAKGLFAGISLQGSMMSSDSVGNRAYYNQPVGPEDIVVAMRVNNPGADPLRAALMRFSGRRDAPATAYGQGGPGGGYAQPSNENGPMQLAPTGPVQQQSLPPPR